MIELTSAEWQDKWNKLHFICVRIGRKRGYDGVQHATFRNKTMVKWMSFVLLKAKTAYYSSGTTIICDSDYDKYESWLRILDPNHKFLQKVGS